MDEAKRGTRNRTEELESRGYCRLNVEISRESLIQLKAVARGKDLSLAQLIRMVLRREVEARKEA